VIKCYDKALAIDSGNISSWINKGVNLHELERYEEAIACYDKALAINPDNISAWNNKGWALYKQKKYDEAMKCIDKSLSLDPDEYDSWTCKGWILYEQGKYEESLECFNKALSIEPDYKDALEGKEAAMKALNSSAATAEPVNKPSNTDTNAQNLTSPSDLEEVIKQLEGALKNGDVEKVLTMVDPIKRENYRSIFKNHPEALSSMGEMIATRKLVFLDNAYAEYLVKEKETSYPMVFEKIDTGWCLSGF